MARHARDREDLLRDARALVPRIMLRLKIEGVQRDVFVGFRGDSASFYFAADPVFHFNARGELRRAFFNDQIIKAAGGQLIIWQPDRTGNGVLMYSRLMSPAEVTELEASITRHLSELQSALEQSRFQVVGQVPDGEGVLERVQSWLQQPRAFKIAAVANVG